MSIKYLQRKADLFQQPFCGLGKVMRALFVAYLALSLLYTLLHFYTMLRYGSSGPPPAAPDDDLLRTAKERHVVGKILLGKAAASAHDSSSDGVWTGRFSVITETDIDPLEDVTSDLLYSKLFQYALKPTKIIPYFFRASYSPMFEEDISVTTLITIERLHVFNNLVNNYKGPVSVALHLNDDDQKLEAIELLHQVHKANPTFAKYVDLHLIIDQYDRQFNFWRNVARFFARSNLIMTMDVDFMLCSDLKSNFMLHIPDELKVAVRNASAVLVVPAFEFDKKSAGNELDASLYPRTKDEMMRYVDDAQLEMFHDKWKRGHAPTDYERWKRSNEPYLVTEYNYNYEPYIMMKRDGLPWCDERFVGYGSNKAACLYEIFLSGAQFWVMPNDFLIHQRHPYPENDRRVERKYNKRLYDAYREEACYRYARMSAGIGNASVVDERICGSNMPNYFGL